MRRDIINGIKKMQETNDKVNYHAIARSLGCDYRTVKRYITNDCTTERCPRNEKSILEDYKDYITEKVVKYNVTAMACYAHLKKKGFTGSYSTVKRFVRTLKKEVQKKADIRFETNPGLQAQVDWKERKRMFTSNGQQIKVNIFVMILGYSRYKYMEIVEDMTQDTLFTCMSNAFAYFGGVPKEILFDNMKTVVANHNPISGVVDFNKKFLSFANDFNFKPIACRPYRPKTKGKVEALAKFTNRLDIYNGEFINFKDLCELAKDTVDSINSEISQATLERPIDKHKRELIYLNPLPKEIIRDYYLHKQKLYQVHKDSMISYKGKRYSVPPYLLGKKVSLSIEDETLCINYEGSVVARHYNIRNSNVLSFKKDHLKEIYQQNYPDWASEDINKEVSKRMSEYDNV